MNRVYWRKCAWHVCILRQPMRCVVFYNQYWLCDEQRQNAKCTVSFDFNGLNAHLIGNWHQSTTRGRQLQDVPLNNSVIDSMRRTRKPLRAKLSENSIFSFTFHYSLSSVHHMPTCRNRKTINQTLFFFFLAGRRCQMYHFLTLAMCPVHRWMPSWHRSATAVRYSTSHRDTHPKPRVYTNTLYFICMKSVGCLCTL